MLAWFLAATIPDVTDAEADGYQSIPAVHLAIRFLLELVMFAGVAMLGWHLSGPIATIPLAIAAMALWGVFGTEGDGTRGAPVVKTPGPIRLLLELTLFGLGALGLWLVWSRAAAETFLTISVLHYAITWERQWWLLRGR
jgi:hypothetical protein